MKRAILLTLLIATSSITWGESKNILCRGDVQQQLAILRAQSGTGTHNELGVAVNTDGIQAFTGVKNKVTVEVNKDTTLAVIHSHPFEDIKPSAHDMEMAHLTGIPVYVVTRVSVYAGTPLGEIYEVGQFKTFDLYTADPEGPPTYGREHHFQVTILENCITSVLTSNVHLTVTHK